MRGLSRSLLQFVCTVLLGALLSASLVRFAPGYGMTEDLLDTRLSSLTPIDPAPSLSAYYVQFLAGYVRGDLGQSATLGRPVRDLVAERAPTTLTGVAIGLTLAWTASSLLSFTSLYSPALSLSLTAISAGILQCVPAGIVALLLFLLGWHSAPGAGLAAGILVYPRIAQYLMQLIAQAWQSPHVVHARAKGLTEWRVFLRHVLPVCAPQLLSLLGLSLILSLGALIPVEAILDVPGIGQLAWQAALARDLNLLVNITVLITALVTCSNLLLELCGNALRGEVR
ncbi:MAG: ABC transporter permease [Bryobacterales bacterium]|nr:ABC transporter permease [Bryobacterales bacterium]